MLGLTKDEDAILMGWSRWGSDGYPVVKLAKGSWTWTPRAGVPAPSVWKTKRAATAAWEAFIDKLIEVKGEEARVRELWSRVEVWAC